MDEIEGTGGRIGISLPLWAWALVAVAVAVFWTVTMEAGAVSAAVGRSELFLHELFHDGRHLVGVPCH